MSSIFWDETPVRTPDARQKIFAQVALGGLTTDLMGMFGVRPDAAVGYSLGESAALFALRAWAGRDAMLRAMNESTLFAGDLTGRCDAARKAWKLPPDAPVEWTAGLVVDRPVEEVRSVVAGVERAYLLIVNTPRECVVGGDRAAVEEVGRRLGCTPLPLPETSTVHCPVAREVAEAYRRLHLLPTTPPPHVRFYSAGLGSGLRVDGGQRRRRHPGAGAGRHRFPRRDRSGVPRRRPPVRGDGAGGVVYAHDRRHPGRPSPPGAVGVRPGADGVSAVLRLLGMLVSERVAVDLRPLYGLETAPPIRVNGAAADRSLLIPIGGKPFAPPRVAAPRPPPVAPPSLPPSELAPMLTEAVTTRGAHGQAHAAFLRYADSVRRTVVGGLTFQASLLESLCLVESGRAGGVSPLMRHQGAYPARLGRQAGTYPPRSLDRAQCLEFAVGSIGRVLGPDFAAVDAFPTRVRLPDEPLMLVDRITHIEGEPLSLTSGRVVTEHDVRPGAWHLDHGRVPACIAIESGQADLFLSAWLGVDFRTRGLAVYRLLDAKVTFYRGLPAPGQVLRYDIHIERFFRQGDTHLFRFRFEGTADGQPLLTMTNGVAGFFTAEELASGKGVVQTELDRRPQPGVQPDDEAELTPRAAETYSEAQIDALRAGDLAGCFGPAFADLNLKAPMRLPGGRMKLVDRVVALDPAGGRFGVGQIRAEADVHPDDWFLTCHFVDDRVMPGTLMYECCLHTLRIFLMRLGWVGEHDAVVCEPVPGVASQLKCRGQVTGATRTVAYEVTLKERGYRPEPYAIADALMYADGKPIVEITNMCVRFTGLTREGLRELWPSGARKPPRKVRRKESSRSPVRPRPHPRLRRRQAVGSVRRTVSRVRRTAFHRPPARPAVPVHRPHHARRGRTLEAQGGRRHRGRVRRADRRLVLRRRPPGRDALRHPVGSGVAAVRLDGGLLRRGADQPRRPLLSQPRRPGGTDRPGSTRRRYADHARPPHRGVALGRHDYCDLRLRPARRPGRRLPGQYEFRLLLAAGPGPTGRRPRCDALRNDAGGAGGARSFDYPTTAPFPDTMLRMIDRIEAFVPDGGPNGLGFLQGAKAVDPSEWFFRAHFYQDPVIPGSLGLESLLQLLKVAAVERWGGKPTSRFRTMTGPAHHWLYRGQVVPANEKVVVQAFVTKCDDGTRRLTADGLLWVDGKVVYRMNDFTLEMTDGP